MKTRILMIVMAIMLGSVQLIKAEGKEKNVYGYVYAFNNGEKVLYMTNIITGVINSPTYYDAIDPIEQWTLKFRTIVDSPTRYTQERYFWYEDYDSVSDRRMTIIGDYKQRGFTIRYIDDFYYRKARRNNN